MCFFPNSRHSLFVLAIAVVLLNNPAWAGTEKVLYSFKGGSDGTNPYGGVVVTNSGDVFGTTYYGGGTACHDFVGTGCGIVYQLRLISGTWTERVVHRFQGGADGANPWAGLTRDANGDLFGTTVSGGSNLCSSGCGTVFELVYSSGKWSENVLYAFGSQTSDGANPEAGLSLDGQGNLYGTNYDGGAGPIFDGTVFELSPDGNGGWIETVLYQFPYNGAGGFPSGGVTPDRSGNLYGTTLGGGGVCPEGYCGTVYELVRNVGWKEVTLYQFKGYSDALWPYSGVVLSGSGNLYGTTPSGGTGCSDPGCGTVYQLTRSNSVWTESLITSFNGSDGKNPQYGNLVIDKNGNLYGTTSSGGTFGLGTVFKLALVQGTWQETVLYNFQGGTDGASPLAGVTLDVNGNIYGTTSAGGTGTCKGGCGIVFEITQ